MTEAADGISAARPGARRDVLESYIKRLAKLEEIAMSYKGVEMCYAIQAGRELRIMTKSEQISDLDAHQLAKDISKRIEAEMQYPGHIKVVVIRETRAVEWRSSDGEAPHRSLRGRRLRRARAPARSRAPAQAPQAVRSRPRGGERRERRRRLRRDPADRARPSSTEGVDVMTSGNHTWDQKEIIEYIVKENLLLRPGQLSAGDAGGGLGRW